MLFVKKELTLALLAAVGLAQCAGCVVRSVEPWLESKALAFESDLLGGWIGSDANANNVAMTFIQGENNSYVMQYSSKDGQGTFEARLAKFGSDYYMDFKPKENAPGIDGLLLFPMHTAARLELGKDRLVLRQLDYGAVKGAAKLGRLRGLRYSWVEEDDIVLTSSTEELQRFLLSLDRNSELFAPAIRMRRTD
jgi:hypothetical protein